MATPLIGASLSQPILQEEEEEEEEKNLKEIVTLLESSDEFEVFNQPPSPEDTSTDIDFQQ